MESSKSIDYIMFLWQLDRQCVLAQTAPIPCLQRSMSALSYLHLPFIGIVLKALRLSKTKVTQRMTANKAALGGLARSANCGKTSMVVQRASNG